MRSLLFRVIFGVIGGFGIMRIVEGDYTGGVVLLLFAFVVVPIVDIITEKKVVK